MILAEGGKMFGRTLKHELPNYGTFDEKSASSLRARCPNRSTFAA